ncbi:hypothetical protein MN116_005871 [Schistosoma mekongi]|uniref:Tubulin epsilon and delta complex protein 1 domain-containing protein n=1 Tax=Schistosoma mekongi TaxID=38744 RepID=A0AAE2D3Y0_SCHME|nr:hypothetical protein MN116_005871 [Schistosoma mekongi]
MGGSVGIKCCVKVFIRLLKSVGFSELEAENIRLAKFDDMRALHPIKRFTFELIYFIKFGCVDELCAEGFKNFPDDKINQFILHNLVIYGFPLRRKSVDEDLTSRQLLLASIWIILSFDVLSKIELILISTCSRIMKEHPNYLMESIDAKCLESNASIPRLIWLLGRLRIHLKKLYHLRSEAMSHFLKSSMTKPKLLPPSHCWVFRDPNALHQYIVNVQESVSKLHLLLSWRDVSHIFWQWIHSVLIENEGISTEIPSQGWIRECARKLTERINGLCSIVNHFRNKYPHLIVDIKPNISENSAANGSCDLDEDELLDIHEELRILTDLLMGSNFTTSSSLIQYNFRYNIINNEVEHSNVEQNTSLNFNLESECAKLKLIVDKLKTEYETVKSSLTRELQNIGAEFLPEAVFLYKN